MGDATRDDSDDSAGRNTDDGTEDDANGGAGDDTGDCAGYGSRPPPRVFPRGRSTLDKGRPAQRGGV